MPSSPPRTLRFTPDLEARLQKVHQAHQEAVPGVTWTRTVMKVIKRGLDALEADQSTKVKP